MKPGRFFPDHNLDVEQVEATASMPPDSAVATLVAKDARVRLAAQFAGRTVAAWMPQHHL